MISGRFSEIGGGDDYIKFFEKAQSENSPQFHRLKDNCLSLGAAANGAGNWKFVNEGQVHSSEDLCKVLFVMNMVGAGKGTTVLWETEPPKPQDEPKPWQSEQETAAMHIERNLREINHMCSTGHIAARLQVLVCEPIPAAWTNWMDSLLVACGGTPATEGSLGQALNSVTNAEENARRYSPLQVVVSSSPDTADTCHNLKSGFMERRMQDLILSVPQEGDSEKSYPKTSHHDLVSSDDFDVYVGVKWTSLVTIRSLYAFLQASVDLSAAAASDLTVGKENPPEFATVNSATSPFLIPSFVRMSYVSEENNKVAKWRMHGDFFHPAGWEISRDSFDMTWIPHSIAGAATKESSISVHCAGKDVKCGQWWIYLAEEQMPTSPDIYANENTIPIVRGGSNFMYMLTERHRREIVDNKICKRSKRNDCTDEAQAIIPLGDMESFISNYMPNTGLGKKHATNRRPGYSRPYATEENREAIRKKKKIKDQEDIEKALFDYTVYPAALMKKDATLKAARSRDATLSGTKLDVNESYGMPSQIRSRYFDVSITKPRDSLNGLCMSLSRRGLCTLYADYVREGTSDTRCHEHCGLLLDFTPIENDTKEI